MFKLLGFFFCLVKALLTSSTLISLTLLNSSAKREVRLDLADTYMPSSDTNEMTLEECSLCCWVGAECLEAAGDSTDVVLLVHLAGEESREGTLLAYLAR